MNALISLIFIGLFSGIVAGGMIYLLSDNLILAVVTAIATAIVLPGLIIFLDISEVKQ